MRSRWIPPATPISPVQPIRLTGRTAAASVHLQWIRQHQQRVYRQAGRSEQFDLSRSPTSPIWAAAARIAGKTLRSTLCRRFTLWATLRHRTCRSPRTRSSCGKVGGDAFVALISDIAGGPGRGRLLDLPRRQPTGSRYRRCHRQLRRDLCGGQHDVAPEPRFPDSDPFSPR